jgi:AcrR family transcriptional regulator
MTSKKRLTPEDWLAAGFRQLATQGPAQLKAEVLARALGTTKGSFYWHFADLAAYKDALLQMWRDKVATETIAEVLKEPTSKLRLQALGREAERPAPDIYGGRQIDPAMRAWALTDPKVMVALKQIDRQRLDFLKTLLDDIGIDGTTVGTLIYAAYLGLDDLAAKHGTGMDGAMQGLVAMVLKDVK